MKEKWLIINWLEIAMVPLVIIAILLLMMGVRYLASKFELSPEVQRKTVHVAVGISSLFFPLIFSTPLPVFLLIACTIFVMLAMRRGKSKKQGIGSVLHSVSRPSYGEIYLALAVAFLFFRSEENPILFVLPLLVLTLSDTASALVGTAYGRLRFTVVEGTKSLEGVVAFFLVTWICAMIVLLLMSNAAPANVILLSFLIAAFCSLIEADSWRGLDNLFVPVGAHLLLEKYLSAEPMALLWAALFFTIMILIAIRFAATLGITTHEARSRTILIFLILTVTSPENSVLPFFVIFSHTLAGKFNPCESRTPVLDLIAISAGVGLFWLLAGEAIETTVINLFNMTFASVTAIFATLAVLGKTKGNKWQLIIIPISLAIIGICTFIAHMNPVDAHWFEPMWPLVFFGVVISTIIAWVKPAWFSNGRCLKSFGIALIGPVILYIIGGVF